MRFDLHLRNVVKQQIQAAAQEMTAWEGQPGLKEAARTAIRDRLIFFNHMTQRPKLRVGGVDGSGDFPALVYADSGVYFSVAQGVIYESSTESGLKELPVLPEPIVNVAWIPEDESKRAEMLLAAFEHLAGRAVREVIGASDYKKIHAALAGRSTTVEQFVQGLILPHPTDTGNLAIQLRSSAELGAAIRLIFSDQRPTYVLVDTTLSLPLVGKTGSLFFEHLKRLCCVEATTRGIGFFALSKSHGLPSVEVIEAIARAKAGIGGNRAGEHWFLRLPIPGIDEWGYETPAGKRVPPHGAVSYLFRLHRSTPVMRLDMDINFWKEHLRSTGEQQTQTRERAVFQDIDYTSHDQRAYGYPYPIKACHDRTSMTMAERVALRKQIIDAAVAAGMRRSLFRDVSIATGHA